MSADDQDDLLAALGQAAADRDAEDDALWAAVMAENREELPEGADLEALAPLTDAEEAAIAGELAGGAQVVPLTRSRRRLVAPLVAVVVAAAAAALLMLGPSPQTQPGLQRYSLQVRSGEKVLRNGTATAGEIGVYSKGAVFDFALVPDEPVEDEVAVVAFVVSTEGAKTWSAPSQRLPGGALRIRGRVGQELSVDPGEYVLRFFVGRTSDLPRGADDSTSAQRFESKIRIR